jgi:hypothetical protein
VRDYAEKKTALRAAPQIHRRYPVAIIELMPFEFRGVFWRVNSSIRSTCRNQASGSLPGKAPLARAG